jgi:ketosteroid isomerase-like protein
MKSTLVSLLFLLGGSGLAAAVPREEIIQAERAFNQYCLDHGRHAGWMEFIADDAYLMNRNTLGRAEADASLAAETSDTSTLTWEPSYADASLSGDLGYSWGIWVVKGTGPDGQPAQRRGLYLTVWRRQADGRWKFVFDGGRPLPEEAIASIHESLRAQPAADYGVAALEKDRAKLERELWDLDVAFSQEALTHGPKAAFLAHIADEALLLDRGVRTKTAAAEKMAREPDGTKLSWAPLHVEMAAAGDLALVWGEWLAQDAGPDGKPSEATGVYSALWKRQPGGGWKIVFDNGRPYSREIIARLKQRLAARAAAK